MARPCLSMLKASVVVVISMGKANRSMVPYTTVFFFFLLLSHYTFRADNFSPLSFACIRSSAHHPQSYRDLSSKKCRCHCQKAR